MESDHPEAHLARVRELHLRGREERQDDVVPRVDRIRVSKEPIFRWYDQLPLRLPNNIVDGLQEALPGLRREVPGQILRRLVHVLAAEPRDDDALLPYGEP